MSTDHGGAEPGDTTTSVEEPPRAYPLRLEGTLDPHTSRALWLVKWLLLVPHYIVLAFLWLAFGVFTVFAFFAILVTGRYPGVLFDFNVGVLRWSWRVAFYGYNVLGTDRYPPFSLHDVPSYPAHLEVDPPARLSRGLVLVKWWLLAIPHYLVVAIFIGGATYSATYGSDDPGVSVSPAPGLISLLVLFAAVVLLFRHRFPRGIFDLVLGLNRWCYRVAAYVTLMTDRYPPFALDQGGQEPVVTGPEAAHGTTVGGTAVGGTAAPAASPPPGQSSEVHEVGHGREKEWSAGKVVSAVIGSLLVVTGFWLGAGAAALAVIDLGVQDDDGYLMSDDERLTSSSVAIISDNLDLAGLGDAPEIIFGETKLEARQLAGTDLFIGVGPTREVRTYLANVPHDVLVDLHDDRPVYRHWAGAFLPPGPPEQQDFWDAQASGRGTLDLTWKPSDGDWTYVVMNADASQPVAVDAAIGAKLPILEKVGVGLAVAAVICLVVGAVLIAIPLVAASRARRSRERATPQAAPSGEG